MGKEKQNEVGPISDDLKELLSQEDTEGFRNEFLDLHPHDQAMFFREQAYGNRMKIYTYLSPLEMSDIMEYIDLEEAEKFVTEMEPQFAAMVRSEMALDDAVDILTDLAIDEVASFLAIMAERPADEIKALLHYDETTAGSIMATESVSVLETQTAKVTLQQMEEMALD